MKKDDGGERIISTPKTYLKVIQWWICDNILSSADIHDSVHGFRAGRSYITNASTHLGCRHILNIDIMKFFPSINMDMISALFQDFGYKESAVKLLAELVSLNNEAPTGAPTSPAIGNLVLKAFDAEMANIAAERGMRYTRYADDLTFSSLEWIPDDFLTLVTKSIESHGFSLNGKKTRFMGRGDRMEITGVVINDRPNATREWRNWARGYVQRALRNPESYRSEWQTISGIYGTLHALDSECKHPLTIRARQALALIKPTNG